MKLKFKKFFLTLAATASLIIPVSITSCSDNNQTSNNATTGQDNSPNQPTEGNSGSSGSGDNTGGNSSSNPSNPSNTPSQSMQSNDELPKLNTPLDNSLGLPITPDDDPDGYTSVRAMEECSALNAGIYDSIILKVVNKYCNSSFISDNIVTTFSGYDPKYFHFVSWDESKQNYYIDDEEYYSPIVFDNDQIYTDKIYRSYFFNNLDSDQKKQLVTIENTTWHKIFSTYYVVINSDKPLFNDVVDTKDNNAVVKDCIWLMKNTTYQYLIKLNVASKPFNLCNLYFTPVNLKVDEDGNLYNDETSNPKEILINLNAEGAKDDYYYQPTLFPIYLKYNIDDYQNFYIMTPVIEDASANVSLKQINQGQAAMWDYVFPICKNTIDPFQGWWDETPYDYFSNGSLTATDDAIKSLNNSVTKTNLLNLFKKIDPNISDFHISLKTGGTYTISQDVSGAFWYMSISF